jgi:hypothetical protein
MTMTPVMVDRTSLTLCFPGPMLDVLRREACRNGVSVATIVRKYVEIGMAAAPHVSSLGVVTGYSASCNGGNGDEAILHE